MNNTNHTAAVTAYIARRLRVAAPATLTDAIKVVRESPEAAAAVMSSSVFSCLDTAEKIIRERRLEDRFAAAWVADALCYLTNDGTPYEIRRACRA